jgi:hypothetical protein
MSEMQEETKVAETITADLTTAPPTLLTTSTTKLGFSTVLFSPETARFERPANLPLLGQAHIHSLCDLLPEAPPEERVEYRNLDPSSSVLGRPVTRLTSPQAVTSAVSCYPFFTL